MAKREAGRGLATIYAQALYGAATESGVLAQVEEELRVIRAGVSQDVRLRLFLETPTVSFGEKRKVLLSALHGLSPVLLNFLCVVIRRGRVALLERIAEAFHEHANQKAGVAEFNLASARALESHESERLKALLKARFNKSIVIREEVHAELLGGFVLTYGDHRWTTALSHRLARLVRQMEVAKSGLALFDEK